jgi:predicted transcriptional regulator
VGELGSLERAVMEALWELSSGAPSATFTARQVAESFPDHAYTTLLTILDRLAKKGFVEQIRDGKTHHYRPTKSRDAYIAELMHEALNGTSDRNAALVRFAQTVSADQAAILREVLRSVEGQRQRGQDS